MATSNHVHLLVKDQGKGEIPKSMQLIAGCTAQAYSQRKSRRGTYWEDHYHVAAVETRDYLAQCMVYIDLNKVRAGAVGVSYMGPTRELTIECQWVGVHQEMPTAIRWMDTRLAVSPLRCTILLA